MEIEDNFHCRGEIYPWDDDHLWMTISPLNQQRTNWLLDPVVCYFRQQGEMKRSFVQKALLVSIMPKPLPSGFCSELSTEYREKSLECQISLWPLKEESGSLNPFLHPPVPNSRNLSIPQFYGFSFYVLESRHCARQWDHDNGWDCPKPPALEWRLSTWNCAPFYHKNVPVLHLILLEFWVHKLFPALLRYNWHVKL